jgi:hypothetical protein
MFTKNIFGIVFFTLIVVGCGTNNKGGKFTKSLSDKTPTEEVIEEPKFKTGVLLDSSVSGIKYKTTSQLEGVTNEIGEYNYNDKDLIEFFVGDISLGEVEAKELIVMSDFRYPHQVAQFLQTIDSDNLTQNGITIAERLHKNPLLDKSSVKDDNASMFAKRLDIKYFDNSERNLIFISQLLGSSSISHQNIIPLAMALEHTKESQKLENIRKNSPNLYDNIVNIDVNDTINKTIVRHKSLKSRLIYYFYRDGYREILNLQAKIEDDDKPSDELIAKYQESYLSLIDMSLEILLYSDDSQKDVKRKIVDTFKDNNIIKEALVNFSLDEDNKTKEAKEIVNYIAKDINQSSVEFISKSVEHPQKAEERKIAIAYLDLYLSCNSRDIVCLNEKFENNDTIDSRLWFVTTKNETYNEETPSLYSGAKDIIDNYISKMSKLSDTVSQGLPKDRFLNRTEIDKIDRVSMDIKPLKIESWEDTHVLWIAIDIKSIAGADINITSFEPKLITKDKEIALPNSHLYTALEQSYSRTNSAINILTPIFIEDESFQLEDNTQLMLEIYFRANNSSFQAKVKNSVDLNWTELSSDILLSQFNKTAISFSKNMETVEEGKRFFFPTVKLGVNRLENGNIEWKSYPNNIELKSEDGRLYIDTYLNPTKLSETQLFKVSNRLDPYSQSSTFVLNIIRKKRQIQEDENEEVKDEKIEEIFSLTLENIENNSSKKLTLESCKTKSWRVWRNLKFALKDRLSSEDIIIKSIQGCLDIKKLVEEDRFSYEDATNSVAKDNSLFQEI